MKRKVSVIGCHTFIEHRYLKRKPYRTNTQREGGGREGYCTRRNNHPSTRPHSCLTELGTRRVEQCLHVLRGGSYMQVKAKVVGWKARSLLKCHPHFLQSTVLGEQISQT